MSFPVCGALPADPWGVSPRGSWNFGNTLISQLFMTRKHPSLGLGTAPPTEDPVENRGGREPEAGPDGWHVLSQDSFLRLQMSAKG